MLSLLAWLTLGASIGAWYALERTKDRSERACARILEMDPSARRSLALGYNALRRLFACAVWAAMGAGAAVAIWIAVMVLVLPPD